LAWLGREPGRGRAAAGADVVGDLLGSVRALLPRTVVTGIALEIGTVDATSVLNALLADNWLHAHGQVDSELGRVIKAEMQSAFYPDCDLWRGMALGQSLIASRQALAGLRDADLGRAGRRKRCILRSRRCTA
jgi:hypothetical protein